MVRSYTLHLWTMIFHFKSNSEFCPCWQCDNKTKFKQFSYRLELMRQIYNSAESPESVYQLPGGERTPTNEIFVQHTQLLESTSSSNNPRLSLANLLPSR